MKPKKASKGEPEIVTYGPFNNPSAAAAIADALADICAAGGIWEGGMRADHGCTTNHATRYVVRTDVGTEPHYLCAHPFVSDQIDTTSFRRQALEFSNPEQARALAEAWSDFPGVWRVVCRPPTRGIADKTLLADDIE